MRGDKPDAGKGGSSAQGVPRVHVVDDSPDVCKFVCELLSSSGYEALPYPGALEFLEGFEPRHPECLLVDIRMPLVSGFELQRRLHERGLELPVILMTGFCTTRVVVQAFKQGAQDFLEKPLEPTVLLGAVEHALERDRVRHEVRHSARLAREQLSVLTPREREVFEFLVRGSSSKSLAASLHISKKTVDLHRANVMHKLEASFVVDLVRISLLASGALERRL